MANETKPSTQESEEQKRVRESTEKRQTVVAAEKQAKSGTGFVVAEGKSLVTQRGVVDAGQPVGPLDFVKFAKDEKDGERRLLELMEKGYVVDQKASKRSAQASK